MTAVPNGRLLFNEIPSGSPEPGKTTIYDESQTIDLDAVPLNGGVLLKTIVLSIDPYMRGRMRSAEVKSYVDAFKLHEPLVNHGIATVLRSEYDGIKVGDHVLGVLPFQQYTIWDDVKKLRVIKNEEKLPWSVYIGVGGMPGKTAFYAWSEFAHPQKGDVVFVSTGAGPVGSVVIQLAKAEGLKVIASAGSDEKVEFMKSIGVDVAFNYKTTKPRDILAKEGPVNIYWDNVGGETLDAALEHSARHSRFIECGMIAGYNGDWPPLKNYFKFVTNEIKLSGFIQGSLAHKYEEDFYKIIPKRIASGEIKYTEDLTEGLQNAGHGLVSVLNGTNKGKKIIVVARD